MKPTFVRAMSGRSPTERMSAASMPGAAKPLHETVTKWVIDSAARLAAPSAAEAARTASAGACGSYTAIRSAVDGPLGRSAVAGP
jgi:hypothetical protein